MRITLVALSCALLATTWLPAASANDEPPALAHNPFSRPSAEANNIDRGVVDIAARSGSTLTLTATMIGPVVQLANVAGRILKPGDEVHGYLLVSIHEGHAVFKKDGKLTTLYVKPQPVEDDD
jgi:hypothetical protein